MKTFQRLAAVAVLGLTPALVPALALAASAQEQLRNFVSTVTAATGSFSQYTVNDQGRTVVSADPHLATGNLVDLSSYAEVLPCRDLPMSVVRR